MSDATAVAARKKELNKLRGSRFINYAVAESIVAQLEDLMELPQVHRMPNLLIVGDTNNGKSMIINRFVSRHRPPEQIRGEPPTLPVVLVQAPDGPDERKFYSNILTTIYEPARSSARVDRQQREVILLLKAVDARILIVDDIHNILAGASIKQQQFRNLLRFLGNELRIPIVGVGTRDAYFAIRYDKQLENRFGVALVPNWKMGPDFLRLLMSMERELSLPKQSNLAEPHLAQLVLARSEGTIGELATLLVMAAQSAVEAGTEQITEKTLKTCGYVPPSKRGRELRE